MKTYLEQEKEIQIAYSTDVIVCGGGPAGVAAAIASARMGARTLLLENNGCLGGIWTSGLLSWIIDAHNKSGIIREIIQNLDHRNARIQSQGRDFTYDPEAMKLILESMCEDAGVQVMLHTKAVATIMDGKKRIAGIITENKSGRKGWLADIVIDATGDGDVAAQAGCHYQIGRDNKESQPLSLMAMVSGLPTFAEDIVMNGVNERPKQRLLEYFKLAGLSPSYAAPSLFKVRNDLYAIMANHEYGVSCNDAVGISQATIRARREINKLIDGLRLQGEEWSQLHIVATAEQIGIRDGRRVKGLYQVSEADVVSGVRHEDAVCRVEYGVDIHDTNPNHGKAFGNDGVQSKAYDIPFRALIAADVKGLLLAGRCISGDFIAHSSYRVTGNSVAIGHAAGVGAALSSKKQLLPQLLNWKDILTGIQDTGGKG